jgi:hypothetical protein
VQKAASKQGLDSKRSYKQESDRVKLWKHTVPSLPCIKLWWNDKRNIKNHNWFWALFPWRNRGPWKDWDIERNRNRSVENGWSKIAKHFRESCNGMHRADTEQQSTDLKQKLQTKVLARPSIREIRWKSETVYGRPYHSDVRFWDRKKLQ